MQPLRIDDIARAIGEPSYAVRGVADRFMLYIPCTRIADDRLYAPDALEFFRLIFDQLHVGVRDEYIDALLARRFPIAEVSVAGVHGSGMFGHQAPVVQEARPAAPSAPTPGFDPPATTVLPSHWRSTATAAVHPAPPPPAQPAPGHDEFARLHEQISMLYRRIEELGALVTRAGHLDASPVEPPSPAPGAFPPGNAAPSPAAPPSTTGLDERFERSSQPAADDDFADIINRPTSRLGRNVTPRPVDANGNGSSGGGNPFGGRRRS